jgi:hypothetical protein
MTLRHLVLVDGSSAAGEDARQTAGETPALRSFSAACEDMPSREVSFFRKV